MEPFWPELGALQAGSEDHGCEPEPSLHPVHAAALAAASPESMCFLHQALADLWLSIPLICAVRWRGAGGQRWDLGGAVRARDEVKREEVDRELEGRADLVKTRKYIEQLERELGALRAGPEARCQDMLGQALTGSEDADVQFVFEGGPAMHLGGSVLRGHRGMLSSGSEEFAGIFRSRILEAHDGMVPVPPGIGVTSFCGFLEWLYLGASVCMFGGASRITYLV